jgi:hypothetical protein
MSKVAALCGPAVLAELESICAAVLKELRLSPWEYHWPGKPDSLRIEVSRRIRVLGAEDNLAPNQVKRAVVRSFKRSHEQET